MELHWEGGSQTQIYRDYRRADGTHRGMLLMQEKGLVRMSVLWPHAEKAVSSNPAHTDTWCRLGIHTHYYVDHDQMEFSYTLC